MLHIQHFKKCSLLITAIVALHCVKDVMAQQNVFKVQIVADDMCCKGCAQKVAAQLYSAPGVTSVQADVPNRVVTVTAKASPKLTVERLWRAVEQGKGGPSKLVAPQATYVLFRPESLPPEQRLPIGRYSLEVKSMHSKDVAQTIANQIYSLRDVQDVGVDLEQRKLFVQSANGAVLSPWALAIAAERAQGEPVAIAGPFGVLMIERSESARPTTAAKPGYSQTQGEVR
jgi:copper chaperone CopZ